MKFICLFFSLEDDNGPQWIAYEFTICNTIYVKYEHEYKKLSDIHAVVMKNVMFWINF